MSYHRRVERTEVDREISPGKRVVVIGAGIVGASLAYHLAAKGADVSVVEAEGIASGVTGTSFAWINPSHPDPGPIALLRGAAINAYRRLETRLPGLSVSDLGQCRSMASPSSVTYQKSAACMCAQCTLA